MSCAVFEFNGTGYYFNVWEDIARGPADYRIEVTLNPTTAEGRFVVDIDITSGPFGDRREYSEWRDDLHSLDEELARRLAEEAWTKFVSRRDRFVMRNGKVEIL